MAYDNNTKEWDNTPLGLANRAISYAKKDLPTVKKVIEALGIEVEEAQLILELQKVKLSQVQAAVAKRETTIAEEANGAERLLASMDS